MKGPGSTGMNRRAGPLKGRAMTVRDLSAVCAFWRAIPQVGLNESDTVPALTGYLRRNPGLSLVVTAGKKVVGAVLCGHDGRRGYLHHLAVAQKYRRRGLGRAMAGECMKSLRFQGIHKCNIFIFADGRKAGLFWEKAGWKKRSDLFMMQAETGTGPACRGNCSGECRGC